MGEAKRRKARLLSQHPVCCFCGGTQAATTVDHVPNRASFPQRAGPEGYEFPACSSCQNIYRKEEHYFALVARLSDLDDANYDGISNRRLIKGIANNYPELLPIVRMSPVEKRRIVKSLGLEKPSNIFSNDIPIAKFPQDADRNIRKIGIKLGLALYYKHKGKIAKPTHYCSSYWTQISTPEAIESWRAIAAELPGVVWGQRPNMKLGNRFGYAFSSEAKGEPDIFLSISQFGKGLAVCSMVWEGKLDAQKAFAQDAVTVRQWSRNDFPESWPFRRT